MLKVNDLVNPSPEQFEIVIHGMRNAFESWDKSDSELCEPHKDYKENCKNCSFLWTGDCDDPWITPGFKLGKNDQKLLTMLTKLGTSDRKVLRMLPVIMDITASSYWWRQFDTYKVGTTGTSTSQMHTLLKKPFYLEDFSFDEVKDDEELVKIAQSYLEVVNVIRLNYLNETDSEKKSELWFKILELLPQSFNYTRTVSLNYENVLTIIGQRLFHKLPEWKTLIIAFLKYIPYMFDLAESAGLVKLEGDTVLAYKNETQEWLPFCKKDELSL